MSVLAVIPPPPIEGFELGPLNLRLYGLLIAIGAFFALRMTVRRYASFGGNPGTAEMASLVALGGGFLGARIGFVIPRLDHYLDNPQDILAIWQGGLAFFGGLTGGALALYLYVRLKRASMPAMCDAIAPALPLAQAIGRWGNYFNQELFGRPTAMPWALEVETEPAQNAGYLVERTFHPTFLYESLWNFALVGVILWIDRRGWLRRRGSLMFVYLIGYGTGRAWIEALRVDTAERYFGLSRNNWIAFAVVLIGVVGLTWWERRESAPLTTDLVVAGDEQPLAEDLEPGGDAEVADDDLEPTDTDLEPADTDLEPADDIEVADTDLEPADTDLEPADTDLELTDDDLAPADSDIEVADDDRGVTGPSGTI